jgi:hypothetical protein
MGKKVKVPKYSLPKKKAKKSKNVTNTYSSGGYVTGG